MHHISFKMSGLWALAASCLFFLSACSTSSENPATVDFSYSPKNPTAGELVTFVDESVAGDQTITTRNWVISHSGSEIATYTGLTATHTFEPISAEDRAREEFKVELKAELTSGEILESTKSVFVLPAPLPAVDFRWEPEAPMVEEEVRFIDTTDIQSFQVKTRTWRIAELSGTVLAEVSGIEATFTFANENFYLIQLEIEFESGETVTGRKEVFIDSPNS